MSTQDTEDVHSGKPAYPRTQQPYHSGQKLLVTDFTKLLVSATAPATPTGLQNPLLHGKKAHHNKPECDASRTGKSRGTRWVRDSQGEGTGRDPLQGRALPMRGGTELLCKV